MKTWYPSEQSRIWKAMSLSYKQQETIIHSSSYSKFSTLIPSTNSRGAIEIQFVPQTIFDLSPEVIIWFINQIMSMLVTLDNTLESSDLQYCHWFWHSHYSDITWVPWLCNSHETWQLLQKLVQTNNKENTKPPHCWPFVRRFNSDWWILLKKGQWDRKIFM